MNARARLELETEEKTNEESVAASESESKVQIQQSLSQQNDPWTNFQDALCFNAPINTICFDNYGNSFKHSYYRAEIEYTPANSQEKLVNDLRDNDPGLNAFITNEQFVDNLNKNYFVSFQSCLFNITQLAKSEYWEAPNENRQNFIGQFQFPQFYKPKNRIPACNCYFFFFCIFFLRFSLGVNL